MTRATVIAVLLLIATNTAWCVAWFTGGGLETEVADLRGSTEPATRPPLLDREAEAAAGLLPPGEEVPEATLVGRPGAAPGVATDTPDVPGSAGGETPEQAERRARQRAALGRATTTLRNIAQVKDPALRQQGLDDLADVLTNGGSLDVEYGLGVLYQLATLGVAVDLGGFRNLVLSHLEAEVPGVRRSALYALRATGRDLADARFMLAAADDPDPIVRAHAARLLNAYGGGKIEGAAAHAVADLLADESAHARRGTLHGLWGAVVAPEVERTLLEMAEEPTTRHAVVDRALAPLKDKSREVVDALFEYLDDDDRRVRQRSHWGLQRGVPDELKPYVAERYAGHLEDFVNPKTQREALQLIAQYGDAGLAPQLERFSENELVNPKIRETARRAAAYLMREKPRR